jgi:glycosyltransferase involved in cell wall biosynthesis
MRLAFLTHEPFYPPSGGGSAEAIYLVQELVRRGHEVHLFGPRLPEAEAVKRRFGIEFYPFTAWAMGRYTSLRNFKYLLYPFFLERLVGRVAARTRFDRVMSQHSISAVAAGRLKRSRGIPVVMNFLDYLTAFLETWPPYLAPRGAVAALKRFELSLPNRYQADAVLTVSDVLADLFAETGFPRDRMLPIYFGYDDEVFVCDRPGGLAQGAPVVVMHGSMDHHHLGPIACGAAAHVARRRPEVTFRFVGRETPALREFRAKVTSAAPLARIESTGFISYFEVARQLASASVGIVPYEESAGVHCAFVAKAVEYLAMGLPVVSTPLRNLMRYFGDEPLLRFASFDGPRFGEAILKWLDTPLADRQRWGKAASERVKNELSWRRLCRRAIDFVENPSGKPNV